MTPSHLLRLAAERIEEGNWCQGGYSENGRACAWGRLALTATECGLLMFPALEAVKEAIGGRPLEAWNDDVGRTHHDVRALFLRVADQLETEAQS